MQIPGGRWNGTWDQTPAAQLLYSDQKLTVTGEPAGNGHPEILHFQSCPAATTTVQWDAVLWNDSLYVKIPLAPLPDGSKDGFTALLEYAEEHLKVVRVIVCFFKCRCNVAAQLVRTFRYLGFELVKQEDDLVPPQPEVLFLAFTFDIDSSDEECSIPQIG
uniref:Ornithine decarboxylase antizyme 1 n=1 Tax=Gouania willdenowi TaxID=441366 RepID=A0A8C5GCA1_GOUWI